jgi:hypothetical protein
MFRLAYVAIPILAVATVYGGDLRSYSWPQVAPTTRSFRFSGSRTQVESLTVKGTSGKQLYWLGCHSSDFEGNSGDPAHDDDYYYGDLDCHLH